MLGVIGASSKVDKRMKPHKVLKAFAHMQLVYTRGATVHVFIAEPTDVSVWISLSGECSHTNNRSD